MKVDSNNQLTNNFANSFVTTMFQNPQSIQALIDLGNKLNKDKK